MRVGAESKIALFFLVGTIVGLTHYWFFGPPDISLIVGLLAGAGGLMYVELFCNLQQ
jgi:hypothetical protein